MSSSVPKGFGLSIIVPVSNRRHVIDATLRSLSALDLPGVDWVEILVVDDGSRDGSPEIVERHAAESDVVRLLRHRAPRGYGACLRTGIGAARGELILFQDAELEFDPRDYDRLLRPFFEDGADVVYGSRFLASGVRRVLSHHLSARRKLWTRISNWFTDLDSSDVATPCKMFRAPVLHSIPLRRNDDTVHLELTSKVSKRRLRLFEVPIKFLGPIGTARRSWNPVRALKALATILLFWLKDDIYEADQYGSSILHSLERTHRFNRWMAETVARRVGDGSRVLEIGAGIGNMTQHLLPRDLYVASDINPNYLHYLRNYSYGKPYLRVDHIDLEDPRCFEPWHETFDTVICLNVLEHVADPLVALRNMARTLQPGGRLVVYVPQGQWLFSSLDEVLEHRCRYDRASLAEEISAAGLSLESCDDFNRCSVPGWWLNGRLLRKRRFSRVQLKLFDLGNPLIRHIDRFVPWPGLGLIATARRPAAPE